MNIFKLASLYFKVKGVIDMKNWKTSLFGIIGALGVILPYFGIPAEVGAAAQTVGVFLMGIFAKDLNVTGGTVK